MTNWNLKTLKTQKTGRCARITTGSSCDVTDREPAAVREGRANYLSTSSSLQSLCSDTATTSCSAALVYKCNKILQELFVLEFLRLAARKFILRLPVRGGERCCFLVGFRCQPDLVRNLILLLPVLMVTSWTEIILKPI